MNPKAPPRGGGNLSGEARPLARLGIAQRTRPGRGHSQSDPAHEKKPVGNLWLLTGSGNTYYDEAQASCSAYSLDWSKAEIKLEPIKPKSNRSACQQSEN
ncbi:hypothetical protein [Paenibacillus prosopidis]|uniref:hypothetical protein n=1 Tax=Paenibacillus prosopidis TaxID=630520 RepID=UPI000DF3BF5F|nr:hypothetical protein [Paenibacillus prosopidis]